MAKRAARAVNPTGAGPPQAKRPAIDSGLAPPEPDAINAAIQHELSQHDAAILAHPIFSGILDMKATNKSGARPYNSSDAVVALESGEPYVASCPLFWTNLNYELQPNMPKYKSRTTNLQAHLFKEPALYPDTGITVIHTPGDAMPHLRKGQLKPVCPPELRDALRQAIVCDVADNNEQKLRKWLEMILSTPPNSSSPRKSTSWPPSSGRSCRSGRTLASCTRTRECPA